MSELPTLSPSTALPRYHELHAQLSNIIKGQEQTLHYILACYLTGHHVLLEDYPGTGKTTLAKTLANLFQQTEFNRVQFTPDLLPSDLTGVNIYDPHEREFRFQKGPIFCDILLADEINRASPRTQSALLEAMAEHQVTIEGCTYPLSEHFFVIATQNPVEMRGTYPLPEAQMDRFAIQCSLGYLTASEEKQLLDTLLTHGSSTPCITTQYSDDLRKVILPLIQNVHVSEPIKDYIIALVSATRTSPEVSLPLSPRASLTLMTLAQVIAFIRGQDFVTAEHVRELSPMVLAHRLLLNSPSQCTTDGKLSYIHKLLDQVRVPG